MTRTTPRPAARAGFTLIEVLVVLAIIVVLVSMGAAAYMKIANYQQRRNTETLVAKLDDGFRKKWRTVLDTAKTEQPNAIANALSNGDARRAQVIHVLMCLRREFPTNFAEATQTITVGSASFGPNPTYWRLLQSVNAANYSAEQQSSV